MNDSLRRRANSFVYAIRGIVEVLHQANYRIELALGATAYVLGWYLNISSLEWVALVLVSIVVLSLEMINTAIEVLCDKVHPEKDEHIRIVKDISAGAVFVAAFGALIIGALIFLPKIWLII